MTSQLSIIAREQGLADTDPLIESLGVVQGQLGILMHKAAGVTVTSADQLTEMKQARELRLQFKELRCATENTRKRYKDEFLRKGRAIDALANWIKDQIEPTEKRLQEMEDFAVRAEEKRKAALVAQRKAAMEPYVGAQVNAYNFAEFSESDFKSMLRAARIAHEKKLDEEAKAEEARLAAEKAKAEEAERLRTENAKLQAAAKEARHKADAERKRVEEERRKEREAAEAIAKKEREAREAAELALRKVREQEAKEKREAAAKAAAEEVERMKAAAAPDIEKTKAYLIALMSVKAPVVENAACRKLVSDMIADLNHYMQRWEKL